MTSPRAASIRPEDYPEERYKSMEKYSKDVAHLIDKLVKKRFLLCEDTDAYYADLVQAGLDAGIPESNKPPKPQKNRSMPATIRMDRTTTRKPSRGLQQE